MTLSQLVEWAKNKSRFQTLDDYAFFCEEYLSFIFDGLQAVIVSQNENHYRFFQYREDGNFNVTRPINSNLMITIEDFHLAKQDFNYALQHIRDIKEDIDLRRLINQFIYTCQQMIGAALDALPAGESNKARKLNGDLFERYIRMILQEIGVSVHDGVVSVPVFVNGEELFKMSYQHDLIIEENGEVRAIGSVKTSSKDRIDKILTGHFKGYTIKLNPLDGVYYCDLRPNMLTDDILASQIRSLDALLTEDIWRLIE